MSGEDSSMQDDQQQQQPQRARVQITTSRAAAAQAASASGSGTTGAPRRQVKTKGRGFKGQYEETGNADRYDGQGGEFESIEDEGGAVAQKSVEGWLVIATGVHDEANEDELYELFADHGEIKQLHLNLDRRTGYVKGYLLVEYGTYKEAQAAIQTLNGYLLHEKPLTVDWALKPAGNGRTGGGGRRQRQSGGHGGGEYNRGGGGRGQQFTSSSSTGRGPVRD